MDTSARARSRASSISRPRARSKVALREILADMLDVGDPGLKLDTKPSVILVIGVNGVGKTTTIGKLAHQLTASRAKRCSSARRDTFRAAAADQLDDLVRSARGVDHHPPAARAPTPRAVVYDAIAAAKARGMRRASSAIRLGSLHNKQNLMNELDKIARVHRPRAAGRRASEVAARAGWRRLARTACMQAKQFQECGRRDRHRPDEAGRHRQGRHVSSPSSGELHDAGQIHRRRRADG